MPCLKALFRLKNSCFSAGCNAAFFNAKTVHKPVKFFAGNRERIAGELSRKAKPFTLYSFIQQAVAVAVPVQYFYLIAVAVMEYEHRATHRVKSELLFHY